MVATDILNLHMCTSDDVGTFGKASTASRGVRWVLDRPKRPCRLTRKRNQFPMKFNHRLLNRNGLSEVTCRRLARDRAMRRALWLSALLLGTLATSSHVDARGGGGFSRGFRGFSGVHRPVFATRHLHAPGSQRRQSFGQTAYPIGGDCWWPDWWPNDSQIAEYSPAPEPPRRSLSSTRTAEGPLWQIRRRIMGISPAATRYLTVIIVTSVARIRFGDRHQPGPRRCVEALPATPFGQN